MCSSVGNLFVNVKAAEIDLNDYDDQTLLTMPVDDTPVLCADTAEDLGITFEEVMLASDDDVYGDLSEYTLSSEHFIINENLYDYLPKYISPEKFNYFINGMNKAYDAMVELIGNEPCGGAKVEIKHEYNQNEDYVQWVYIGDSYIYWNTESVVGILNNIENNTDGFWFSGTLHELGHLFDDCGDWNYNSEGSATYKAWLAMMYCNDVFKYSNSSYTKETFIQYISTQSEENVAIVCNPLFMEMGFEAGWEMMKKIYSSYYDPYFPVKSYEKVDETIVVDEEINDLLFAEFVDRCSHFIESDIMGLTSDSFKEKYQKILDNIAKDTKVRVELFPKRAKIGDELIISVYNVSEPVSSRILLWRGSDWYEGHTNKTIELQKGNNYNISLGYQLDDESAGMPFIVYTNEVFSNWIGTSDCIKEEKGIEINKNKLILGDEVSVSKAYDSYQWQSSVNGIDWNDISLANDNKYTISEQEIGKLIRCKAIDSNGDKYVSYPSDEIKLFSAYIIESNVGLYSSVAYLFNKKSDILKENSLYIKFYIDDKIFDTIEVNSAEELIGWSFGNPLEEKHLNKKMYAELYFKYDETGCLQKIVTPVVTIN